MADGRQQVPLESCTIINISAVTTDPLISLPNFRFVLAVTSRRKESSSTVTDCSLPPQCTVFDEGMTLKRAGLKNGVGWVFDASDEDSVLVQERQQDDHSAAAYHSGIGYEDCLKAAASNTAYGSSKSPVEMNPFANIDIKNIRKDIQKVEKTSR